MTDSMTQGETMTATAAQSALEHTVAAYLIGVGAIVQSLAQAARGLAEDGLSLLDFATLLEGGDLSLGEDEDLG